MIVKMVLITNFSFRFFQASFCYARVKGGACVTSGKIGNIEKSSTCLNNFVTEKISFIHPSFKLQFTPVYSLSY